MELREAISKNVIPLPTTPLLGREKEVEELVQLLEQHSVVTITGTGGIGKTRIAIEICHNLKENYWYEIFYLSLATLTEAREILPPLADSLGITETSNRTLANAVSEVLADKAVVLVLDNLEHVTEAAHEIAQLVATCPGVKVLCTSRVPLRIRSEQVYPLKTLPVPDQGEWDNVMKFPAIELFISRARMVNKDFAITTENSQAVVEICRYLDGLPLALELAASRLRILSPSQLLTRLKKSINILSDGAKDLPVRHQTLRNTIEWSYELLSESEKKLFRRLAVFAKGFSLEAIEKVCYDSEMESLVPIHQIEFLVDKALVQKQYDNHRFILLQTIKDFAKDKWMEGDEIDSTSMKHAEFYHGISELIYEGTQGKEQQDRMQLGIREEPNILLALDYLLEQAKRKNKEARELGLQICGNLWTFWHIHGKHVTTKETINAFFAACEDDTPSLGKCGALFSLHVACYTLGEIELSREVGARLYKEAQALDNEYEMVKGLFALAFGNMFSNLEKSLDLNRQAIRLSRKLETTYWLGLSLWQGGIFNLISGNLENAEASYSEALELFKKLEENEGIGIAQSGLCMLEFMAGNYDLALELYTDTLEAFRAIGDRPEEARTLSEMSWTHLANGDTHLALEYALKSINAHREIGSNRGIGLSLNAFAAIEAVKGHPKKALEIAAAARHFADQKGVAIELGVNDHGKAYLENAKQQLSPAEIEQAEKDGKNLSVKDILELVENKAQLKPQERAFLQKLENAIEENLSDCSFGVVQMCDAVAMSHIQVYRKLRALKNQSPTQFIRDYRLQKGKDLLTTSDKTVAEVAFEVGFSDPNYFSRIFSKEFSQTPTEFRKG